MRTKKSEQTVNTTIIPEGRFWKYKSRDLEAVLMGQKALWGLAVSYSFNTSTSTESVLGMRTLRNR